MPITPLRSSAPCILAALCCWCAATLAQTLPATRPIGTVADRHVRAAEAKLKARPDDLDGLVDLATGFMLKARETGDGSYYARAARACERAIELHPGDYGATRMIAWVYGGQHRFRDAAAAARRAMTVEPDDPWNYGTLADALLELGDYDAAETAVQRMVDLRPSAAAYARVAHVRELIGDTPGAIEMMAKAARIVGPRDPEQHAWCLAQLGNLLFGAGRLDEADNAHQLALKSFPGYYLACTGLGRVRVAQGRAGEAVKCFEQSLAAVPTHDTVVALGDLLVSLGRTNDAAAVFRTIDTIETINRANGVEPDAQVALFYADHDCDLDAALRIAAACAKDRQDVRTMDALAWTLYRRGQYDDAATAIAKALRLGTRDAAFHFHAGMIQSRLGNAKVAVDELTLALSINPHFHAAHATEARQTIADFSVAAEKEAAK